MIDFKNKWQEVREKDEYEPLCQDSLLIGWAEKSITPQKKASLIGQFAERISEYVEKPITATAMAIESGNEQAVIVSVDVNGVSYNLIDAIRVKIAERGTDLDPMNVVYAATHTHTAPTYPRFNSTAKSGKSFFAFADLLKEELPKDKKYIPNALTTGDDIITPEEMFDLLTDRLAEVTIDAWNNRKTAAFSNAFGRATVGHCRRAVYKDGSAAMWGDTATVLFEELEGGSDTGIELLYTYDESEKVTGVVINLACPAQSVQHRKFISPDFWGEVKIRLREYFGKDLFVLALCSAAGDQCPVDLIRFTEPESELNDPNIVRNNPPKRNADPSMFDISGMKKIGKRISAEVIDVFEEDGLSINKEAVFRHSVKPITLPLRTVTSADVKEAKKSLRDYINNKDGDMNYNDTAYLNGELGILARYKLQEYMDTMEAEVHIIRLGNIVFATNPFEPFIKYGNQIKARSVAEQTFIVQLAAGFEGYLPTEKAEIGGHYSGFVASGLVGHIGGDLLVKETLNEIKKLF